jgi:hypothetical protein
MAVPAGFFVCAIYVLIARLKVHGEDNGSSDKKPIAAFLGQ